MSNWHFWLIQYYTCATRTLSAKKFFWWINYFFIFLPNFSFSFHHPSWIFFFSFFLLIFSLPLSINPYNHMVIKKLEFFCWVLYYLISFSSYSLRIKFIFIHYSIHNTQYLVFWRPFFLTKRFALRNIIVWSL